MSEDDAGPRRPGPRRVDAVAVGVAVVALLVVAFPPSPVLQLRVFAGLAATVLLLSRTVAQRLACYVVLLPMLALLLIAPRGPSRGTTRATCAQHLKQVGMALYLYRQNLGLGEAFPAADGAELLVVPYRAGVVTDASIYLCPATADHNHQGAALTGAGPLAPHHVSYAGRRNADPSRYPGLFEGSGADTALASDDDEAPGRRFNHRHELHVLFVDGHVEAVTKRDDPRLTRGVARSVAGLGRGGLLDPLAN